MEHGEETRYQVRLITGFSFKGKIDFVLSSPARGRWTIYVIDVWQSVCCERVIL